MRIPILYIPKLNVKKFLYIEQHYRSKETIIPIGCDCHPAYTLEKLHIRQFSLPFDWLNVDAVKGIRFVQENLQNNFSFFLTDLYRNEKEHIVSKRYPYAEFMHEKDLIENAASVTKLKRRIDRFLKIFKTNQVSLLYCMPAYGLDSEIAVDAFFNDLKQFAGDNVDKNIYLYIRCDESIEENRAFCDDLMTKMKMLPNVSFTRYVRFLNEDGIWGNPNAYVPLYRKLGIEITRKFPKIYIR